VFKERKTSGLNSLKENEKRKRLTSEQFLLTTKIKKSLIKR
jgi:hypothetical protein